MVEMINGRVPSQFGFASSRGFVLNLGMLSGGDRKSYTLTHIDCPEWWLKFSFPGSHEGPITIDACSGGDPASYVAKWIPDWQDDSRNSAIRMDSPVYLDFWVEIRYI